MCRDCGCYEKPEVLKVEKSITLENDKLAHELKHRWQHSATLAVNVMGAPGSGKTTFIEQLSAFIDPSKILVIQGDLESDIDQQRLLKQSIQTLQINTHSGCHLNAHMITEVIGNMDINQYDFLLIENVGNLVCPAGVDLGQHLNLTINSVTEGADKPRKYPLIFRESDIIVVSKYDLQAAVDFDEGFYFDDLSRIAPKAQVFKTSRKDRDTFRPIAESLSNLKTRLQPEPS